MYKKGLNDPDKHNGVITHLEPDILQCQAKWVLGSITNACTLSHVLLFATPWTVAHQAPL